MARRVSQVVSPFRILVENFLAVRTRKQGRIASEEIEESFVTPQGLPRIV
jgi:hypothetical protein